MTYAEIIRDNCDKHSPVSWWPRFAFHYTDVQNAVSILDTEFLYSRTDATSRKIMRNDNASRQVIYMTNSDVESKVRFYFRPLTPTQYYNEGYKHPALRYSRDENANTPVPIFFLFDLDKLLSIPGVQFSETTQAGHGAKLLSEINDFSSLNFDNIYNNDLDKIGETKQYRHAEILHPNSINISTCLNTILCRNMLERATLLNLLKEVNPLSFQKYQNKIKVHKQDTFERNGLFITDCIYHDRIVSISFSDSLNQRKYTERMMIQNGIDSLNPIDVKVWLEWKNARTRITQSSVDTLLDYQKHNPISIKDIPIVKNAKELGIKVFFDGKLMCYSNQSLEISEVIK